MTTPIFTQLPADPNQHMLDADLYTASQQAADQENVAATGNLNIGLVVDYDARAERLGRGQILEEEPGHVPSYSGGSEADILPGAEPVAQVGDNAPVMQTLSTFGAPAAVDYAQPTSVNNAGAFAAPQTAPGVSAASALASPSAVTGENSESRSGSSTSLSRDSHDMVTNYNETTTIYNSDVTTINNTYNGDGGGNGGGDIYQGDVTYNITQIEQHNTVNNTVTNTNTTNNSSVVTIQHGDTIINNPVDININLSGGQDGGQGGSGGGTTTIINDNDIIDIDIIGGNGPVTNIDNDLIDLTIINSGTQNTVIDNDLIDITLELGNTISNAVQDNDIVDAGLAVLGNNVTNAVLDNDVIDAGIAILGNTVTNAVQDNDIVDAGLAVLGNSVSNAVYDNDVVDAGIVILGNAVSNAVQDNDIADASIAVLGNSVSNAVHDNDILDAGAALLGTTVSNAVYDNDVADAGIAILGNTISSAVQDNDIADAGVAILGNSASNAVQDNDLIDSGIALLGTSQSTAVQDNDLIDIAGALLGTSHNQAQSDNDLIDLGFGHQHSQAASDNDLVDLNLLTPQGADQAGQNHDFIDANILSGDTAAGGQSLGLDLLSGTADEATLLGLNLSPAEQSLLDAGVTLTPAEQGGLPDLNIDLALTPGDLPLSLELPVSDILAHANLSLSPQPELTAVLTPDASHTVLPDFGLSLEPLAPVADLAQAAIGTAPQLLDQVQNLVEPLVVQAHDYVDTVIAANVPPLLAGLQSTVDALATTTADALHQQSAALDSLVQSVAAQVPSLDGGMLGPVDGGLLHTVVATVAPVVSPVADHAAAVLPPTLGHALGGLFGHH